MIRIKKNINKSLLALLSVPVLSLPLFSGVSFAGAETRSLTGNQGHYQNNCPYLFSAYPYFSGYSSPGYQSYSPGYPSLGYQPYSPGCPSPGYQPNFPGYPSLNPTPSLDEDVELIDPVLFKQNPNPNR